jgi:hypothetical protein
MTARVAPAGICYPASTSTQGVARRSIDLLGKLFGKR